MNWFSSGRPELAAPAPADAAPERVEGAAPGVAAILKALPEDGSLAIIDFGPANDLSLRMYSRFARWVRFADVFGENWPRSDSGGVLAAAVPNTARPYDIVFAWDFLDRLFPEDRSRLVEWIGDHTAPDARLHLLLRGSDKPVQPLRFTITEMDRIRCEVSSDVRLPPSRLVPADLGKLLAPMRVVNAFTLKTGFREYVVRR